MTSSEHIRLRLGSRRRDELINVTVRGLFRLSTRDSPQGLRRPRFSFFRFNCQTAKLTRRRLAPSKKPNRLRPNLSVRRHAPEKLAKTGWRLDRARRRRRRWRVYRSGFSGCQTIFEKSSRAAAAPAQPCGKPRPSPDRDPGCAAQLAPLFIANSCRSPVRLTRRARGLISRRIE